MSGEWSFAPRTLHDNKMEEELVVDYIIPCIVKRCLLLINYLTPLSLMFSTF
jgi:hypothetical protein